MTIVEIFYLESIRNSEAIAAGHSMSWSRMFQLSWAANPYHWMQSPLASASCVRALYHNLSMIKRGQKRKELGDDRSCGHIRRTTPCVLARVSWWRFYFLDFSFREPFLKGELAWDHGSARIVPNQAGNGLNSKDGNSALERFWEHFHFNESNLGLLTWKKRR